MEIKILEIEKVPDNEKLKGIATIEIKDIVKISGIKILQGSHDLYCCCPNQSHTQNGLRKWSNILTFERDLWKEIQEKIIKEYEEKEREDEPKKKRRID
ncbi:putative septation protein SpoVG [subsurface metagenome]